MTGNSPSGRMAPVVPLNRGTSTSYIVDRACINKVVKNNDICFHGLDLFKCSKCKGVRSHDRNNTWLLDSGASAHFTFEKSDFIRDRKSTRLNSSHQIISYAVFCLKKKKTHPTM